MRSLIAVMFLLTACASRRTTAATEERELGTFAFSQPVNDASPPMVVQGTIAITADTITVEMPHAACMYVRERVSLTHMYYRCGTVALTIDRRNPRLRSSFAAEAIVRVPVRTCVQYERTPSGAERCARYTTVYEERRTMTGGELQLRKVAG